MYPDNCLTYKVMVPGLVTFIVQIVALFLQVELNPVVETNDFRSRSYLSNKDVFKSAGVQAGKGINSKIIYTLMGICDLNKSILVFVSYPVFLCLR